MEFLETQEVNIIDIKEEYYSAQLSQELECIARLEAEAVGETSESVMSSDSFDINFENDILQPAKAAARRTTKTRFAPFARQRETTPETSDREGELERNAAMCGMSGEEFRRKFEPRVRVVRDPRIGRFRSEEAPGVIGDSFDATDLPGRARIAARETLNEESMDPDSERAIGLASSEDEDRAGPAGSDSPSSDATFIYIPSPLINRGATIGPRTAPCGAPARAAGRPLRIASSDSSDSLEESEVVPQREQKARREIMPPFVQKEAPVASGWITTRRKVVESEKEEDEEEDGDGGRQKGGAEEEEADVEEEEDDDDDLQVVDLSSDDDWVPPSSSTTLEKRRRPSVARGAKKRHRCVAIAAAAAAGDDDGSSGSVGGDDTAPTASTSGLQFTCGVCRKKVPNLAAHMFSEHSLNCDICGRAFKSSAALSNHVLLVHKGMKR